MGRQLRIFEPGSYYHLTSRGSDGQAIVRGDLDRLDFLRWLSRTVFAERWRLLTYCLMRLLAKWWKGPWSLRCRPRALFRGRHSAPKGAHKINPGSICRGSAKNATPTT